jgi:hypothetical protein
MPWYSVRCVIRFPPDSYEERITLWEAGSSEAAIDSAELDVADYVDALDGEYVGLAQAFLLPDVPSDGTEVFSLMRESNLPPKDYVDKFFDTGRERQRHVDGDG